MRHCIVMVNGLSANHQRRMLSGIGPAAKLSEHNISVVYDSQGVGENLHDHFALYLAFRLRNPTKGYAMGSPAWGQKSALNKGLPWHWVVSQPIPAELLANHEHAALRSERSAISVDSDPPRLAVPCHEFIW